MSAGRLGRNGGFSVTHKLDGTANNLRQAFGGRHIRNDRLIISERALLAAGEARHGAGQAGSSVC